jgi:cytochrome c biogenesis protein CcmG, thiol:disulfide interchange protein DsbE
VEPVRTRSKGRHRDFAFRVIAVVAAAGLVAFIAVVITSRPAKTTPATFADPPLPALKPGSLAPAFSLNRLGGGTPVTLSEFRGRPVVLNFFASWCTNCQAELAGFASFAREHADRVSVVGVDTNDSDGSAAKKLLERVGADYPVALDPLGKIATSYLIQALPVTYLIEPDGKVAGTAFGQMTTSQLESWLKRLGVQTS